MADIIIETVKRHCEKNAFQHPAEKKGNRLNMEEKQMDPKKETRVAVIGIVVESYDSVDKLNEILCQYASYIIGRMGIPYREKKINIISVAVDAPQDVISAMSGKIGRLPGIHAKTAYASV